MNGIGAMKDNPECMSGSNSDSRESVTRLCNRYIGDYRGSFGVQLAILLVPLALAVGLAVDVADGFRQRSDLQSALDAAVLAGVSATIDDLSRITTVVANNEASVKAAREFYATKFLEGNLKAGTDLKSATLDYDGRNLSGIATSVGRPIFMQIVGYNEIDISAKSMATSYKTNGLRCIHATDPTTNASLILNSKPRSSDVYSGASLQANNCTVQVDSTSPASIILKAGEFSSGENCFTSRQFAGNPANLAPAPLPSCSPLGDRLAGYKISKPSRCDFPDAVSLSQSGETVVGPGSYCGGLTVSGTRVKFRPGNYFISGGNLEVEASGLISGDGVSFHISDGGTFNLVGDQIELKALRDGSLGSFVFFRESAASSIGPGAGGKKAEKKGKKKKDKKKSKNSGNLIKAEQRIYIEGVVYAGDGHLEVRWRRPNSAASPIWTAPISPFSSFVAATLDFHGYSKWAFDFNPDKTDLNVPDALRDEIVSPRLVY